MRKIRVLVLALIGCLMFGYQAYGRGTQTIKLKYIDEKKEAQEYMKQRYTRFKSGKFTKKSSENLTKEPDYIAKNPFYALLRLGRGQDPLITVVMDKSKASPSGHIKDYDIIRVDANNNEDLSDDEPISLIVNERQRVSIAVFTALVEAKNGKTNPCKILFTVRQRGKTTFFYYKIISYYQGNLKIGGKNYHIALYDRNSNGTYNDPKADLLILWKKGGRPTADNQFNTGSIINLNNKFYSLETSETGEKIKWALYTKTTGRLKIDFNFGGLTSKIDSLTLDSAKSNIPLKEPILSKLKIPSDSYRIPDGVISLTDNLTSRLRFQYNKHFVISKNKTTKLKLGRPLNLAVQLRKTEFRRGERFDVNGTVIGAGGEVYTFLDGKKIDQRFKVIIEGKDGIPVKGVKARKG